MLGVVGPGLRRRLPAFPLLALIEDQLDDMTVDLMPSGLAEATCRI